MAYLRYDYIHAEQVSTIKRITPKKGGSHSQRGVAFIDMYNFELHVVLLTETESIGS